MGGVVGGDGGLVVGLSQIAPPPFCSIFLSIQLRSFAISAKTVLS